jgi:hypothetical protein
MAACCYMGRRVFALFEDIVLLRYDLFVKATCLQSSWSASRTLIRFFIISKLEKKIMFTTQERRTDTPRPTSVRSQHQ